MLTKLYKDLINCIISFWVKLVFFLRENIRRIRKVEFENIKRKYIFYSRDYNFILFGNDKYISRQTYINGPHDFDLFLKSKFLLKKKIEYLIDVGANIGTFCIPAVKKGGIKKCIAFEPIKNIFNVLNINILLNNVSNNFETFNYLISDDKNENLNVIFNKNNYGDNKFRTNKRKKNLNFNIKKLDEFFKKFDHKKLLIKIDVQGFEGKVLNGGNKFLSKKVPLIVEFDSKFIQNKKYQIVINKIKKYYNYISILDIKNFKKKNISNIDDIMEEVKNKKKQLNCLIF